MRFLMLLLLAVVLEGLQSITTALPTSGSIAGMPDEVTLRALRQADKIRTTAPGAKHYREIAGLLRLAARSCQFAGAERKYCISRYDSRAEPSISIGGQTR